MTAATVVSAKRLRNFRTKAFRDSFAKLPSQIQDTAFRKFRLFVENTAHPSLKTGTVMNAGRPATVVWVDYSHRAVYRAGGLPEDENVCVWEWIGTAEEFNTLYMSGRGPSSAPHPPHRNVPRQPARPKKSRAKQLSVRDRRTMRIQKVLERQPALADRVNALLADSETPAMNQITPSTKPTTTVVQKPPVATAPATAPPPAPASAPQPPKGEWTPNRLATVRAEVLSILDSAGRLMIEHPRVEKELLEVMEQHESSEAARKRLVGEIEQLKRLRTTLEERVVTIDARVTWLEKENEKLRAAGTVEQKLRIGVEAEVAALRQEGNRLTAECGSHQRRIEALLSEREALAASGVASQTQIKALEAERASLRAELEKAKQVRVAAPVTFQSSGRVYLINDFNPEQVPISGCGFRMRPITFEGAEALLQGGRFQSGLSPRVAPLLARALGVPIERGPRPNLRPGDECVLVHWQMRNAPPEGNMPESEFKVWAQWLRWHHVQILPAI